MAFVPVDAEPDLPSPLTTGSLIARTFSTWGARLSPLSAVTALLLFPVLLLTRVSMILELSGLTGSRTWAIAALLPLGLLGLLAQMRAVALGTFEQLAGRPVRFGAMLAEGVSDLRSTTGLALLAVVGYAALSAVIVALKLALTFALGGALATAALLLVGLPLVLFLANGLSLTVPVMAVERLGPIEALRRSWELTRFSRGSVFAATLVVELVGSAGLVAVFSLTQMVAGPGWLWVAQGVVVTLVAGLVAVQPAVAFHDLRDVPCSRRTSWTRRGGHSQ